MDVSSVDGNNRQRYSGSPHCTRLDKEQSVFVGKALRLLERHLARTLQIRFVANQEYHSVRIRQVARVRQPAAQVVVRRTARYVVHHQSAGGSTIVRPRDYSVCVNV